MILRAEILEQPARLETMLAENGATTLAARRVLSSPDVHHVVMAARGTSDNAARFAKYILATRLGLPVTLATPSLHTRYSAPPDFSAAAVVGISQSGQSPDLIAVLEDARNQGRPTIVITNDPTSPLAELGDVVIPLLAGAEMSVAATKTYTSSLLALAMIADDSGATRQIPAAVAATLDLEGELSSVGDLMGEMDKTVVLGRGYNHSTAFEWALKLQEMAYVFAHAFSPADFAHGPFAVLDEGFPVLAVVAEGAVMDDSLEAVRRVMSESGARVFMLTDREIADIPSVVLPRTPEFLSPIVFIVGAQLCTLSIARARGVDPESPRGLEKVTRTS